MPRSVRSDPLPSPPGIAQCTTYTDLCGSCFDLFHHLGPQLHSDPILMVKFLRIAKSFVKEYSGVFNGCGQVSMEIVSRRPSCVHVHVTTGGVFPPHRRVCAVG